MDDAPKPLVLVADDDPSLARILVPHLRRWGYHVAIALDKVSLFDHLRSCEPSATLLDLCFGDDDGVEVLEQMLKDDPSRVVVMLTAHGSIESAVSAIKRGAYDYLTKPANLPRLEVVIHRAVEQHRLTRRLRELESLEGTKHLLLGNSPAMSAIRDEISGVAPTDATVLIQGESGTGKELVAQAIHQKSKRCDGPFIPLNMAAIPRELIESTLFGHEKGAFTGADKPQEGSCQAADGGTLFLDEITEMDVAVQSKLLRFLQERSYQRVGSTLVRSVDVRIVAATNQNPREQVEQGLLREDLFYRLNVVPIELPPLRDRSEDVPLLITHFVRKLSARYDKHVEGFSPEAITALTSYSWPGNVRELQNVAERLVVLCNEPTIDVDHLPDEIKQSASKPTQKGGMRGIEQVEKQAIVEALDCSSGNVRQAAKILGLGQATVYRKIKRYGIVPKR